VPAGRLGRLFQFGLLAGELAAGGIGEGLRRLWDGNPVDTVGALLNPRNALKLAERLSHLRGAAMKLGQLISLEGEELLPPEFTQALALLRADANPMPAPQLRRLLGREYGKGWERRFADFAFEPLAAASIGQVHRARTADGRDLALKVQYPGIARSIDSDIDNVALLLRGLNLLPVQLDVSGLIAEAKRQLHQEADYLQEARYLRRFRELVADDPALCVPQVHADFTTRHILAMDFVPGIALDRLAEASISQECRDAAGHVLERLLFRELFEFRCMQTDPNFANYLFDPASGRIVLLDFGAVREFTPAFVANYARICRAIILEDRAGIAGAARDIGYLNADDPAAQVEAVIDLMLLVCEALRHDGCYDFAGAGLPARARSAGLELAFKHGYLRAPPPETLFLHRKLAGAFLICARLRACVDVQGIIRRFL